MISYFNHKYILEEENYKINFIFPSFIKHICDFALNKIKA